MQLPYPLIPVRTQGLSYKTFKVPPLDGSLCFAQQFDWQAENSPDHPLFEYVNDDGTPVSINYATAQYAVHRGARSVLNALKEAGVLKSKDRPVVAILAASGKHCISYEKYCTLKRRQTP